MEKIEFVFVQREDLQDLIVESLSACLKQGKETQTPGQPVDQIFTVKEAADFLNLSVQTVYSLISKREIPAMKRSKRCYFSREELVEYLKKGRKKTNDQVREDADQYFNAKQGRA